MEKEKLQRIVHIDQNVKRIILNGGSSEDILIFFADTLDDIFKSIIMSTPHETLNKYCAEYDGFYTLMKTLEDIALATSKMKK